MSGRLRQQIWLCNEFTPLLDFNCDISNNGQ
jgi:hypothetical protein